MGPAVALIIVPRHNNSINLKSHLASSTTLAVESHKITDKLDRQQHGPSFNTHHGLKGLEIGNQASSPELP